MSATSVPSFLKDVQNKIKETEEQEEKILKKNCPHCSLFPELKARFQVQSAKKVCPKKYIKEYDYKKSIRVQMTNFKCNKERINDILEEYMKSILKKNASEEAKKLWAVCPDPCSFDTGFSIRINEIDCVGSIDLKILCTNPHRGFFGPIYNALIEYKRGLQCKSE